MNTPPLFQTVFQQIIAWSDAAQKYTEKIQAQVVLSAEAFRGGWLRENFTGRGASGDTDLVVLMFIAQHARPLRGDDLQLMIERGFAAPQDEGRLYARVTDVGLSDEMGKDRRTIAASTRRLSESGFIKVIDLETNGFRDSRGRYAGSKLYLLNADLPSRFAPASALSSALSDEESDRVQGMYTVESGDNSHRVQGMYTVKPDSDPDSDVHRVQGMYTKIKPESESEVLVRDPHIGHNLSDMRAVEMAFAEAKGGGYHLSIREQKALQKLLEDGFSRAQILAAIAAAFERKNPPQSFHLVATILREAATPESIPDNLRPAVELLEANGVDITNAEINSLKTLAEIAAPPAKENADAWVVEAIAFSAEKSAENILGYARRVIEEWAKNGKPSDDNTPDVFVIDVDLTRAVDILSMAGMNVTQKAATKLRLMADGCQNAAEKAGETAGEWLAQAIEQGLTAANPLAYASAVLAAWTKHGKPEPKQQPKNTQSVPTASGSGIAKQSKAQQRYDKNIDALSHAKAMVAELKKRKEQQSK